MVSSSNSRSELYPMNFGSSSSVLGWAELYGDGSGVLLDSVGDGDGALRRKSLMNCADDLGDQVSTVILSLKITQLTLVLFSG